MSAEAEPQSSPADPPYLLVLTPTNRGVHPATVHTLLGLQEACRSRGWRFRNIFELPGDCALARAALAQHALDDHRLGLGRPSLVLWLDDDMSFDPGLVFRMADLGHDFVAMPYRARSLEELYIPDEWSAPGPDGTAVVSRAGFGVVLMRLSVLEKMADHYGRGALRFGRLVALFDSANLDGKRGGDDYSFCHRWREMGGEVRLLVDLEAVVHWQGNLAFQGRSPARRRGEEYLQEQIVRLRMSARAPR